MTGETGDSERAGMQVDGAATPRGIACDAAIMIEHFHRRSRFVTGPIKPVPDLNRRLVKLTVKAGILRGPSQIITAAFPAGTAVI